jgi:hypothetical protein
MYLDIIDAKPISFSFCFTNDIEFGAASESPNERS